MPTVYFIRHGETDWNAAGRLQGLIDRPINATGRGQAKRNGGVLAEVLERPGSLHFVTSPLLRARQTMAIVRQELGLVPDHFRIDERIIEIRFGEWEGKTWTELRKTDRMRVDAREADPYYYPIPGGESYAMVTERVIAWLESLKEDTLVVSHGGIMRCLRGHVLEMDPEDVPFLDVPQDRVMVIAGGKISWL